MQVSQIILSPLNYLWLHSHNLTHLAAGEHRHAPDV